MNRREFGKLIAGTGVAATLPVSHVSAATVQRSKYIFAVALAHAKTDISADPGASVLNAKAKGYTVLP